MDTDQIIRNLGGPAQVAKLCQISAAAVRQWRVKGIPAARRQYLQLLRPDAFGLARFCDCIAAELPATAHDQQDGSLYECRSA